MEENIHFKNYSYNINNNLRKIKNSKYFDEVMKELRADVVLENRNIPNCLDKEFIVLLIEN